jgi:hypothetical protein
MLTERALTHHTPHIPLSQRPSPSVAILAVLSISSSHPRSFAHRLVDPSTAPYTWRSHQLGIGTDWVKADFKRSSSVLQPLNRLWHLPFSEDASRCRPTASTTPILYLHHSATRSLPSPTTSDPPTRASTPAHPSTPMPPPHPAALPTRNTANSSPPPPARQP